MDRTTLLSLIDGDWARRAASLRSRGVAGVIRAGVDGDVAAVLSLDDTFGRALFDANGDTPQLAPITEAGSGSVQEKEKPGSTRSSKK